MAINNPEQTPVESIESKNTPVSCLQSFNTLKNIYSITNALIKDSREEIDFFLLSSFDTNIETLITKSFILDRIFNPLESDENISKKVSIVVYSVDEKGEQYIEFANNTYIEATGLNSLDQIIELSKEGKLYETIYEGEELDNVLDKVSTLDRGGGYYNEIFQMKLTGKKIRWNTIVNGKFSGTVRVGVDVSGIENPDSLHYFDRIKLEKDFAFNSIFNSFYKGLLSILIKIPIIKKYSEDIGISNYLYLLDDDKDIIREISIRGAKSRNEVNQIISKERIDFLSKILRIFLKPEDLNKEELRLLLSSPDLKSSNTENIVLEKLNTFFSKSIYYENFANVVINSYSGKNIFNLELEKKLTKIILNHLKPSINREQCINFVKKIQYLEKLSVIGDIIVNEGPLLVYTDDRGFYNNRILDITGYKVQEINEMLNMGSFGARIFGKDYEKFATSLDVGNNSKTKLELNTKNEGKADLIIDGYALKVKDKINKILIGTLDSPVISNYNSSTGEDVQSYFNRQLSQQQNTGSVGLVETGGENFKDLLED